jgi:hypothetical protein
MSRKPPSAFPLPGADLPYVQLIHDVRSTTAVSHDPTGWPPYGGSPTRCPQPARAAPTRLLGPAPAAELAAPAAGYSGSNSSMKQTVDLA